MREDKEEISFEKPTKRTIESVRNAERVIDIIDDASSAKTEKTVKILRAISQIPQADVFEVVLALPVKYATQLLQAITDMLEKAHHTDVYIGLPVEQCISVGNQIIHLQARGLLADPKCKPVLLRLSKIFHATIENLRQTAGFSWAGMTCLSSRVKREREGAGGLSFERLLEEVGDPSSTAAAKKKSRGV